MSAQAAPNVIAPGSSHLLLVADTVYTVAAGGPFRKLIFKDYGTVVLQDCNGHNETYVIPFAGYELNGVTVQAQISSGTTWTGSGGVIGWR